MNTLKKNMQKENISFDFRLKKIDETRNYLLEEIKQNELMSNKMKEKVRNPEYDVECTI